MLSTKQRKWQQPDNDSELCEFFHTSKCFPLENISIGNNDPSSCCVLLSTGKYFASKQYVRFVHLQQILDVLFLHADILYHFVCVCLI